MLRTHNPELLFLCFVTIIHLGMFSNLFHKTKYSPLRKPSSDVSSQTDIPLSHLGAVTPPEDRVANDDRAQGKRPASYLWHNMCYFLHAFLVALHLILLGLAVSGHPERRLIIPNDRGEISTAGLSGGLQAFYTLYTAVLVFITQRLMLSAIFSGPKKLTQIHDICGAWTGLGPALSALWQQTKVASSLLSIALVTVYFTCISILHVASSTLIHVQPFNATVATITQVNASWPNPSIDLASLDWMAVTTLVPFMQTLYGNSTNGLINNTLYDIYDFPSLTFLSATVNATTVDAQCGLLTNLSVAVMADSTWNVYASMPELGTINIIVPYLPLLNEIWFSPSIQCLQPVCTTFILYLVSAGIEVDDSVEGVNHVYINGTYSPPGSSAQNFSSPVFFVACSLNATNYTTTIDPAGIQLEPGNQTTDAKWSTFSPVGDANLTAAISSAMTSANSLPLSPYCQPILSSPQLWANITAFNAYMGWLLGMGVSSCGNATTAQYTNTSSLLTRGQMEDSVSQLAAEFLWLAGALGSSGGGFDRLSDNGQILESAPEWRLNINPLPVAFALCTSVILLALVVCILWRHPPAAAAGAGVLEIMWFGSRSRVLRDHLGEAQAPSLDNLRASSMLETVFWTRSANERGENSDLYAPVPLSNPATCASSSGLSKFESREPRSSDLSDSRPLNISRSRRWCFALHIALIALHIALLALLVHHPEKSIVIPLDSSTMTIGLSALLQAIYTLYSVALVFLIRRLALLKIVSERRKLTIVHDVSSAWNGIGSAVHILWKQRAVASSIGEIIAVVTYLSMMLALHITSSSIMQWKECNIDAGALQMYLAMPGNDVDLSQLGWAEIFSISRSIGVGVIPSTNGLYNSTLVDVILDPNNLDYMSTSFNATTISAQCGLVSNLTSSYQGSVGEYQINFQNGTNIGGFLESPIWKDVVHGITPNTECLDCPQTLFYLITTGINVDNSVDYPVLVEMNWTYTPSGGGNPQISTTLAYIVACSLSAQPVSDMASVYIPTQAGNTSWTTWSPEIATNLSVGMATAFGKTVTGTFLMFSQGNFSASFTDMDSYIMSLLGLDLTSANSSSSSQSSANPSVTLSPWQLENAIAQTAAKFIWLAGLLGESGGGFQRAVVESPAMSYTVQWCLNVNAIPVILATIASLISLILAVVIIGKRPSQGERVALVSGTSVLECLWLEAHSDPLHSRLETVEAPRLDRLRTTGMFDICLGDVGRSEPSGDSILDE